MKRITGKILSLVFLFHLVFITCIYSGPTELAKKPTQFNKTISNSDAKDGSSVLQLIAELEELEEEDSFEKTHHVPLFVYSVFTFDNNSFTIFSQANNRAEHHYSVLTSTVPIFKKTHTFLI